VDGFIADTIGGFFAKPPVDLDHMQRACEIAGLSDLDPELMKLKVIEVMELLKLPEFAARPLAGEIPHRRLAADLGAIRALATYADPDDWTIGYFVDPNNTEERAIVERSLGKMTDDALDLLRARQRETN
jgi:hypothetical protein